MHGSGEQSAEDISLLMGTRLSVAHVCSLGCCLFQSVGGRCELLQARDHQVIRGVEEGGGWGGGRGRGGGSQTSSDYVSLLSIFNRLFAAPWGQLN